jgi:hypothetical protein
MVATEGNEKTGRIISAKSTIIMGIAVIIALIASFVTYQQSLIIADPRRDPPSTYSPSSNDVNLQKGPPPMPLSGWGPRFQSFDQAKATAGLTAASLPTQVPKEITFDSVRVLSSPGEPTKIITAFYTPQGVSADDSATFQNIISKGGIAIVYTKESVSPDFDRAKWKIS